MKKIFWALTLASLLSACANQPTATLPNLPASNGRQQLISLQAEHLQRLAEIREFQLNGRIAVQMEKQGFSANTQWQHTVSNDLMEVFSPFGNKIAVIARTDQQVTLTTADQKQLQADNVETLTQQALGFKLPLKGLSDWVLGKPSLHGEPATATQYDELGRIVRLAQQGWDIEYSDYRATGNIDLPNKIFLKSPKLNLKMLVESWQLNALKKTAP